MSEKPMFADAKVGDRVWSVLLGWGTVINVSNAGSLVIHVKFDCGRNDNFSKKGYRLSDDVYPALFWDEVKITPPPRPKRKVTKTLEGWVNLYPELSVDCSKFHDTKESADNHAHQSRVACVHVTGTYEVEE